KYLIIKTQLMIQVFLRRKYHQSTQVKDTVKRQKFQSDPIFEDSKALSRSQEAMEYQKYPGALNCANPLFLLVDRYYLFYRPFSIRFFVCVTTLYEGRPQEVKWCETY
ncbi:MAG: hypothetical protein ACI8RD_003495, partial [Bacillariaceae sp.]